MDCEGDLSSSHESCCRRYQNNNENQLKGTCQLIPMLTSGCQRLSCHPFRLNVYSYHRILTQFSPVLRYHLYSRSYSSIAQMLFPENCFHIDRFKGVHIDLGKLFSDNSIPSDNNLLVKFEDTLKTSEEEWKKSGNRLIWFKVPLSVSSVIPALVKDGFIYHHAKPGHATLVKWISENEPNIVPPYPFTNIGVGALVVDDQNRVLVVKEKWVPKQFKMWKFPGGSSEPGEDISEAMKREVFEETGIEVKFKSILSMRQWHEYQFGSDLFVTCLATVNGSHDIQIDRHEIEEAAWIPIETLMTGGPDNELSEFNKFNMKQYLLSKELGVSVGEKKVRHLLGGETTVYAMTKDEKQEKKEHHKM